MYAKVYLGAGSLCQACRAHVHAAFQTLTAVLADQPLSVVHQQANVDGQCVQIRWDSSSVRAGDMAYLVARRLERRLRTLHRSLCSLLRRVAPGLVRLVRLALGGLVRLGRLFPDSLQVLLGAAQGLVRGLARRAGRARRLRMRPGLNFTKIPTLSKAYRCMKVAA